MIDWRRVRRAAGGLALLVAVATGLAFGVLSRAWPPVPVTVHVRWHAGVTDARRADLERTFTLTGAEPAEGTTWRYQLADSSTANIRALVESDAVEDTAHLDRRRFRPEFGQDRPRRLAVYSFARGRRLGRAVAAARGSPPNRGGGRRDAGS